MMNQILDYDALFNERGEQANICTADVGGSYASGREESVSLPKEFARQTPIRARAARTLTNQKATVQSYADPYRRRAVRYVDFDTFVKPERSEEEVRECLQKTALLFGSIITTIVAIAILL